MSIRINSDGEIVGATSATLGQLVYLLARAVYGQANPESENTEVTVPELHEVLAAERTPTGVA